MTKANEAVSIRDSVVPTNALDSFELAESELDMVGGGVGEVIVGHPTTP